MSRALSMLTIWFCSVMLVMAAEERGRLSQAQQDELYAQAVVLLAADQYDAAEDLVRRLLIESPDAPPLIALQRKIQLARKSATRDRPQRAQEDRLQALVLPAVHFRNADPAAVIEWLREASAQASSDGEPVNMVWMVPEGTELPSITLNLRQIPLLDVIRYVTRATGLRFQIDPHAVVIRLPEPSQAPASHAPTE